MKTVYEPTGIILQQLSELVKQLPRVIMKDDSGRDCLIRVNRTGKSLLAEGRKFVGKTRVVKGRIYECFDYVYVDHYKNLIEAFKTGGQLGVDKYCLKVKRDQWNKKSIRQKLKLIIQSWSQKFKRKK